MGLIPIDEKLQVSEELADVVLGLITSAKIDIPKVSISSLMLAKMRTGMDPTAVASTITSRFNEAGIPNGPLQDGSPNSLEILTNIMCEEMISVIQDDMRVDVLIDMGQQVTSFGANAGGPITTQGTNLSPWLGTGIGV